MEDPQDSSRRMYDDEDHETTPSRTLADGSGYSHCIAPMVFVIARVQGIFSVLTKPAIKLMMVSRYWSGQRYGDTVPDTVAGLYIVEKSDDDDDHDDEEEDRNLPSEDNNRYPEAIRDDASNPKSFRSRLGAYGEYREPAPGKSSLAGATNGKGKVFGNYTYHLVNLVDKRRVDSVKVLYHKVGRDRGLKPLVLPTSEGDDEGDSWSKCLKGTYHEYHGLLCCPESKAWWQSANGLWWVGVARGCKAATTALRSSARPPLQRKLQMRPLKLSDMPKKALKASIAALV
ncbi:hypothetical protein DM02DRAFT_655103 [Periconia macrospinosa]|uniref:Uncharacterized protein n=1 Tax=Periconia macrospinosa TaxID=97972 RepID=A0A2V1DRH7_9PLEO|nr:hypothetical protein DM02DRAFT_655103 [Periconia macrospinosa]